MNKPQVSSFQLGLNKDIHDKGYPEGNYTFSLNSINETEQGDFSSLSTEVGNELCGSFPDGFFPNGKIFTGENHVVFLYNIDTNESELGLIDADCNYTQIVRADCLNFSRRIQGTFRIFKGCDRVVYFCDKGNNPDRAINIDNILRSPTSHAYLDSSGNFDCSLIKLKPDFEIPCINDITIQNTGGNLEIGQYQIFLKYEDTNGNQTAHFTESPKFPIINGRYGSDYNLLTGADPANSNPTSKSVVVSMTGLDLNYEYVVIVVGQTISDSTTFYEVDKVPIISTSDQYVLSTVNTPGAVVLDRGDVTQNVSPYDASETMTQHDNRLIRANMSSRVIDYSVFQRSFNDIETRYRWERKLAEDSEDSSGSAKTSTYYVDFRSYMRDEIYSFAIVPILNDGTVLPGFHIPGRKADLRADGTAMPLVELNAHHRQNPTTAWDTGLVVASDAFGNILPNYDHIPSSEFTAVGSYKYIERWKIWNTALKDSPTAVFHSDDEYGEGEMAYWESIYDYPSTMDCEGNRIFPEGKIRHHKFPDTTLEPHFQKKGNTSYIHPIGIQFSNINMPAEYADQIQGFYIVRELRDEVNKTVLDKGIMYVNAYFNFVQDCVQENVKEYAIQSNVFNRHDFREGLQYHSGVGINGTQVKNGLVPKNSSIYQDCGSMGFRRYDNVTDGSHSLGTVRRFIAYDDTSQSYHSPKHKFWKDVYPGKSHIQVEQKLSASIEGLYCEDFCNDLDDTFKRRRVAAEFATFSTPATKYAMRTIKGYASLEADVELPQGLLQRHFLNNMQQETLVYDLFDGLNNVTDNIGAGSANDGVYEAGASCTVYGIDSDDDSGKASGLYVSTKSYSTSVYGQLGTNIYFQASKCMHDSTETAVTVYGGDIFISKFSFFTSSLSKFCTSGDCGRYKRNVAGCPSCPSSSNPGACKVDVKNEDSEPWSMSKALTTFFVESEINTELRHIDPTLLSEADNTYWPIFSGDKNDFLELSNVGNQAGGGGVDDTDCASGTGAFIQWNCGIFAKNRYYYNSDYSDERDVKQYSGLDLTYDYCQPCEEEYPRRIVYSEAGYQEENTDNYRVFLPLSYRDIPPNTGNITNLFVTYDQLYCHTERSLYQIYTKAQNLQSDQATLYIGTGEFFSIPPKEQINTDYAYGGSIEKFATIVTEFGAFYVDSETSKVFMLAPGQSGSIQMQEISAVGLRNYFEEDGLKVNIKSFMEANLTSAEYNTIASFLDTRTGFISTYDPRHKRFILTKKDYKFIGVDITETLNDKTVLFSDPALFEDLSWTISFSLLSRSWISWHSYKPDFYMNNGNDFYSALTEDVFKHNVGPHTNFFGTKYDQIIEVPSFGIETKALNSITWVSETKKYNATTKHYQNIRNITFDRGEVYNNYQSSGTFTILPKTSDYLNVPWSNTTKIAVRTDRNWKISGIRDLSVNESSTISTSDWTSSDYQTAYLSNNFIDKAVNSSVIDYNKSQYELGDIRDKVNYIRLFFKPDEDYKHILFLLNSFNNMNVR